MQAKGFPFSRGVISIAIFLAGGSLFLNRCLNLLSGIEFCSEFDLFDFSSATFNQEVVYLGAAVPTLFGRLTASLRGVGFATTMVKLRDILSDHWFDLRYRIDTCSWSELKDLTIQCASKDSGYLYKPVRILPLRKLFQALKAELPRDQALVDLGSGKGRVLLVAAEFGFRGARGIEFAHELSEISRENCRRYQAATRCATEFTIVETDASKYVIAPDESVFVLCNPFDDHILQAVLTNIASSVAQHPRRILIIYYNPKWRRVIEQQPGISLAHQFKWAEHTFNVYSNQPPAPIQSGE